MRTSRVVGSRVFKFLELEVWPVRVTSAFSRVLCLEGVWVRGVEFLADRVVVSVALRRQRLICPVCGYATMAREGIQDISIIGEGFVHRLR